MTKNKFQSLRIRIGKIVPEYAWLPLIFELTLNMLVYSGSRIFTAHWRHYNIESALDRSIPLVPWTIIIYFGCYLFWAVNYVLCVRLDRRSAWQFLSADFLAKLVCLACFLILPTTNTRPEITGSSIWDVVMCFLYQVDAADNLFPSIHCLTSWFCYIGIRGRREVPKWYRVFSCLFALAVFISTLTTKQHVIIDVIAGAALAEAAYRVAGCTGFDSYYGRIAGKVNRRIFKGQLRL